MGQIRKCLDCGEVFMLSEGSLDKSLNNLAAGGVSVRAAVQSNVTRDDRPLYAANSDILCPYCLSSNTGAGTQLEYFKASLNRDREKKDETDYYEKKIQNLFEGLEVNVDCGAQTVERVSQDCRERIERQIDAIGGWEQISLETILKTDGEFYRPIMLHELSSNTYYITEKGKILFACRIRPEGGNVYRIGDGTWREMDWGVVKTFRKSFEELFDHRYSYCLCYEKLA